MEDGSHIDAEARRGVDTMWRREYALGVEGRFAEQIACVDDVQRRYADSADPEVRAVAVRTLSGYVRAALATGDQPGAVTTSRRLAGALASETDPVVRLALAETVLDVAGRIALAAPGATGPIASIAFAPLDRVAALRSRTRIALALRRRARMLEGLALAQRLIDEFEESPDASLRSVAVQAVLVAGVISGPGPTHRLTGGVSATHDRVRSILGLREHGNVGTFGDSSRYTHAAIIHHLSADGSRRKQTPDNALISTDRRLDRVKPVMLAQT